MTFILFFNVSFSQISINQICEDDDTTISIGLSIWTDVSGCTEAYTYLQSQGLNCLSDLNLPFVSDGPISLISICCQTCQDEISNGCTDDGQQSWSGYPGSPACNYNPFANDDDGSCDYSCYGCTNELACNYNDDATLDDGSCNFCSIGCMDIGACNYNEEALIPITTALIFELDLDVSLMCEYSSCANCMDPLACNYNEDATIDFGCEYDSCTGCMDPGACDYNNCFDANGNQINCTIPGYCDFGVECTISPCSVSNDPYIEGAYCIDDYCDGCCALWYYADGTLISNSCDLGDVNPFIGVWDDYKSNQYIEITEDVIGFYSFLEDDFFTCWYYWPIEYTYLGDGIMQVQDPDYGPSEVTAEILDNGYLQILDPEGDIFSMSPLDELPDIELCNTPNNEGCDDFLGQWSYVEPTTNTTFAWLELYESGGKLYFIEDEGDCLSFISLSFDAIEGSNECSLFFEAGGIGIPFAIAYLNDDGTISILSADDPELPEIWTPSSFDSTTFDLCNYGCTDSFACNYNEIAIEDDGSCEYPGDLCEGFDQNSQEVIYGILDDDCECGLPLSLDILSKTKKVIKVFNVLGQKSQRNSRENFLIYIYDDGSVNKKYIIE